MTAPRPRFVVTEQSELDPSLWAGLGDATRVRDIAALEDGASDLVYLLTVGEAQTLLATHRFIPVLVVWAPSSAAVPAEVAGHPRVAGILDARCRDETVRSVLRSALALAGAAGDSGVAQKLERVLEVGRALASEKDLDTLLGLILTDARLLTQADGASIYTKDREGTLFFRLWQNASVPGAANVEQRPVGESSIAGYVARSGETAVLDDAYAIAPGAPYVFNPAFDQASGYRTRSLLTVPLTNQAGEVVGVLQLINRKIDPGARLDSAAAVAEFVRPFDAQDRAIAQALAGQAGVALENSWLHAEIERLFEGFIKASVQAIESRDPTTAGHSFRVAGFTERLALAVDRTDQHGLRAIAFSKDQLRELRYAALLHDFGKVGVREHVLVKAKKLHPHELRLLEERFRYARASLERRALRELLALHENHGLDPGARERGTQQVRAHLAAELARLDRFLKLVAHANEPNVTRQEVSADLDDLVRYQIADEEGEGLVLLEPFEFASLTLAQGSLTAAERGEIESHVTHTYAFLKLIPWTRNLANLPEIAFAHHEKLDGSGYPRRLTPKEIPVQSRMMTIADIYDALTAGDRPYKHGMSAERALDILGAEARAGKVDAPLYSVFVESQAWRSVEAALATDS